MVNAVLGACAVPDIDRLEQEDEEVEAEVRVGGLPVVVLGVWSVVCWGFAVARRTHYTKTQLTYLVYSSTMMVYWVQVVG